jgi:hypothetical protein
VFRNKANFYDEGLLAPRPNPKPEDHLLSALRDCVFNISAAVLHIGGRSSLRNLRTRHAVVTGTRLSWSDHSPKRNTLSSEPSVGNPTFIGVYYLQVRDCCQLAQQVPTCYGAATGKLTPTCGLQDGGS